jgi:hypothetical protein
MMRVRKEIAAIVSLSTLLVSGGVSKASADRKASKELQRVAKRWCETIRASQVIPVYPLTEDLEPGDVFLVQTPMQDQEKVWKDKGFLPLEDHRVRLGDLVYKKAYFDGYWKDRFGSTPHEKGRLEKPGPRSSPAEIDLSELDAPRAAFPSYSFSAQSSLGLSLALPIHGIPAALGFLHTDAVSGTVTIADAHTYGADVTELYGSLDKWVNSSSNVRVMLQGAVKSQSGTPIFLRVVSRVYLAGGLVVSVTRSGSTGASGSAGAAPDVSLVKPSGDVDKNYEEILNVLNKTSEGPRTLDYGGSTKFISVSGSSVGMAQSFDKPLVIGYLGFDVPVYPGPQLGTPVPTWARLEKLADSVATDVSTLTLPERRYKVDERMLELVTETDPCRALRMMQSMIVDLDDPQFSATAIKLKSLNEELPAASCTKDKAAGSANAVLKDFKRLAIEYVSTGGGKGTNFDRYSAALVSAWCNTSSAGC